ncbi:4-alpha-glucanotransferase [Novispirillum itersonii]|uniref:4-alpha-glucanotransferase n=1 Tax=Novispirillum itersonii TaxID=189 RepID=A0A7W9ZI07_NOVIT|nr:4-alpha-glucanotransferase [Novispirillum itersonii]MBB6210629.1 4-alpha-glucanotransferase [Novispirillum itersonii]
MTDFPVATPPPALTPAVSALADGFGISTRFWDIFGTEHVATPDAVAATLTAMGVDVTSETGIARAMAELDSAGWSVGIPPVTVLRHASPRTVSLVCPADHLPLHWTLSCEDGSVHVGTLTGQDSNPEQRGTLVRLSLTLPASLPAGYHRLTAHTSGPAGISKDLPAGTVILAPDQCWLPSPLRQNRRLWGIGCQVYSLRQADDFGMGDFFHLKDLSQHAVAVGAAFVGVNPLHALFPAHPQDASPYSPCSRLFLNPLYIDPRSVPEFSACAAARALLETADVQAALRAARQEEMVDYPAVSAVKLPLLRCLYETFRTAATPERQAAFDRFIQSGGTRLHQFAVFEVLQARWPDSPWMQWPEDYRDPHSPAVKAIAETDADAVLYRKWLQFEADRQLEACPAVFAGSEDHVGLYRDLAVGTNSDGADVWADQSVYVLGGRFGAPPDQLGPLGQDWGMPPLNPVTLRQQGYAPFIDMVRANMRHAGALRIDHAMSLLRLFWIPPGYTARDGMYVGYPFDDLLGILALESHRNQCMIIGEDLGTVPDGFRDRMDREAILSYRVVYFERYENGLFKRPDTYPRLALSCATSHDIATIQGHWSGWDIALRHRLGLAVPGVTRAADEEQRSRERQLLRAALDDQALLPDTGLPDTAPLTPEQKHHLNVAVHRFLGRAPSALALINLDDLAGEESQVNVPGTVTEYPNWRRRLPVETGTILRSAETVTLTSALRAERMDVQPV